MTASCQVESARISEFMTKKESRLKNEGFGRRLREAIEAKYGERAQKNFADDLKIAQTRVSQYVQGQVPDWSLLTRMADELLVTVDFLLTGRDHDFMASLDGVEGLALRRCARILGSEDDDLRGLLIVQAKTLEETLDSRRRKRGDHSSQTAGDLSSA